MAKPIIALYHGCPDQDEAEIIQKHVPDYHVFFFSPEEGKSIEVFNGEDLDDITIEELKELINYG